MYMWQTTFQSVFIQKRRSLIYFIAFFGKEPNFIGSFSFDLWLRCFQCLFAHDLLMICENEFEGKGMYVWQTTYQCNIQKKKVPHLPHILFRKKPNFIGFFSFDLWLRCFHTFNLYFLFQLTETYYFSYNNAS